MGDDENEREKCSIDPYIINIVDFSHFPAA